MIFAWDLGVDFYSILSYHNSFFSSYYPYTVWSRARIRRLILFLILHCFLWSIYNSFIIFREIEIWIIVLCSLPFLFWLAGLLTREDEVASKSSNILKNLIVDQLSDDIESQPANGEESKGITSMCSTFMEMLDSLAGIPNEHTLAVLSVLFLKLGKQTQKYFLLWFFVFYSSMNLKSQILQLYLF